MHYEEDEADNQRENYDIKSLITDQYETVSRYLLVYEGVYTNWSQSTQKPKSYSKYRKFTARESATAAKI